MQLAARIRRVMGSVETGTVSDSVKALVEAGRRIEAIKLLRESAGLTLEDAKSRVDQLEEEV